MDPPCSFIIPAISMMDPTNVFMSSHRASIPDPGTQEVIALRKSALVSSIINSANFLPPLTASSSTFFNCLIVPSLSFVINDVKLSAIAGNPSVSPFPSPLIILPIQDPSPKQTFSRSGIPSSMKSSNSPFINLFKAPTAAINPPMMVTTPIRPTAPSIAADAPTPA